MTSHEHLDELVDRIGRLQSTGDGVYPKGLFPARRTHRYLPYAVEDDGIFFTAVVVYTLQSVRRFLSPRSRRRIDAITRKAVAHYPRYLNNQGQKIYNFWQVHPEERFFPNGRLLSRFRHFRVPEDADTTAYIYLTHPHSEEDVRWLKQRLVLDTNLKRRRIRNTLPHYRGLKAYSSWLGEANMPIDFDACVLCNILLFVFANKLPLNEHDHDSIRFIRSVLLKGEYASHPFQIAPWYANPSIILYHMARLIGTYEVPGLSDCRDALVKAIHELLGSTDVFMERVLLSTSLMRLGEEPAVTTYPDDPEVTFEGFYFFIGGLLTSVDNPITWALAKYDLFHVRFRCPAHTWTLLLEHEAFRLARGTG